MGFPTKVQLIDRKGSQQWYINFPSALAQACEFLRGEVVEWIIKDQSTLILRRSSDPAASVIGEAEQDQAPSAHDAERGPDLLVAREERNRDVGDRGVQVLIAEQRGAVDDDRHDRRQRERVVGCAQLAGPALHQLGAHQQSEGDGEARQHECGERHETEACSAQ